MTDAIQYRSGHVDLRSFDVDAAQVFEIGDLVYMDVSTDEVFPVSGFTWDTNIATTQAAMANVFVGVCRTKKAAGVAGPISVDVSPDSVYECSCASADFLHGAPLGAAKQSGNALENQKVVGAVAASSIAKATEARAGTTKIRCNFMSAYKSGSGNLNAEVG